MEISSTVLVGDYTVEPLRRVIKHGNVENIVDPLVMRLLTCLIAQAGKVVTREELIATTWPDGIAADQNLSRAIWGLRRALADDADNPKYVETVPRIGYRLIADVTLVNDAADTERSRKADAGPPVPEIHSGGQLLAATAQLRQTIRRLQFAVGILAGIVLLLVGAMLRGPERQQSNYDVVKTRNNDGSVDSVIVQNGDPEEFEHLLTEQ